MAGDTDAEGKGFRSSSCSCSIACCHLLPQLIGRNQTQKLQVWGTGERGVASKSKASPQKGPSRGTVPCQTGYSLSQPQGTHSMPQTAILLHNLDGPPLLQFTCALKRSSNLSVSSLILKHSWHSGGHFQKRFKSLGVCFLSTPCCTLGDFLP